MCTVNTPGGQQPTLLLLVSVHRHISERQECSSTLKRLAHLMWVVGDAVHVVMRPMVGEGQVIIILDNIIIPQIIVWVHAAFTLQPLTLHTCTHKGLMVCTHAHTRV